MKNILLMLVLLGLLGLSVTGNAKTITKNGYNWDVVCVQTVTDWQSELNSHSSGWVLAASENLAPNPGAVPHCMAFYESPGASYSSVTIVGDTNNNQWIENLTLYLGDHFVVLDSWLPQGGAESTNYVAFGLVTNNK